MANVTADRVLETSTTTGDGDYRLLGAVIGFRAVASVAIRLDTFDYFAEDVGIDGTPSGDWEVGTGTMNANGTIARTTIHSSSNNDEPVYWTAGTRRIGLGVSANHYQELTTAADLDLHILPAVQRLNTQSAVMSINAAARLIRTQKLVALLLLNGQTA